MKIGQKGRARREGVNGYSIRATEQAHPLADRIEGLSPIAFLRAMHAEDLHAVRAVGLALPSILAVAEAAATSLRAGGRIIYVGAGSSGRLGALDAAECPPTFGVPPGRVMAIVAGGRAALSRAIEGAEDDAGAGTRAVTRQRIGPRDTLIGITASGDTPFVQGAIEAARRAGATTALICSARPPRRAAQLVILLATGPEIIAGSTRLKAGTAAKLTLNMISTRAMVASGKVLRGRMIELRPTSAKLRARAVGIVAELAQVSRAKALRLVEEGGSVKVAIAMARLRIDRPGALAALAEHGGSLAPLLRARQPANLGATPRSALRARPARR